MSNAHASNTPHRIGQITKAVILVTHLLDTAPADTTHERQAAVIVDQLQTELGWTPPRDPAAVAPLTGPGADPQHRAACMEQIRAAITAPRVPCSSISDGRITH